MGENVCKIDLDQPINDKFGKQLLSEDLPATLGSICQTALLATNPNEKITGKEANYRFLFWKRIKNHQEKTPFVMSLKEVAKLKDLVGEIFSPIVVGQVWELLENPIVD